MSPAPRQVAQFANRGWRNKAAPQQTILMEFCDAFAVQTVGLAAGQGMRMLRVDQHQFETCFSGTLQHIPHWYPEHTRRFHSNLLYDVSDQPVTQTFQIACKRSEHCRLDDCLALFLKAHASAHALLVNVESGTA